MGFLLWLSLLSELYRMQYPWITLSKITWQIKLDCLECLLGVVEDSILNQNRQVSSMSTLNLCLETSLVNVYLTVVNM